MQYSNPSHVSPVCRPGLTGPMGAHCTTVDGDAGVNFAVYSLHAQQIDVCLYDASGHHETARFALPGRSNGIWHGFVPGLSSGQLYGLRAHGPYDPASGRRFNPAKLLLDPYARAIHGNVDLLSNERDYLGEPSPDATLLDAPADAADNATRIPKAQVLNWDAELQAGASITPGPQIAPERTVLYEAHVKGLTQRHAGVDLALRGSYAGVACPAMLDHYRQLGITTLSLLPVHLHITEAHLLKKRLSNYWGYNTLGFFIPHGAHASGQFTDVRAEFRHMVDQLHKSGLEVVLDVVFNHTAESDTFGPTLSWRGLDNASWYALDHAGQYRNHSGCGNSLNLAQPCAIQLVMDSLRWWVQAFGVDGFRFDLATALGRDPLLQQDFNPSSALLGAIGQDPVLSKVKLIAEPWDIGPNGYQLGRFPPGWHEWNDQFRDSTRAYWLGHASTRGDFVRRFTGSSDRFHRQGRSPLASVNLVTAHDGMTLADLTSYNHKHNQANAEDNRDGSHHNLSANAGVEGPTGDRQVCATRTEWRRALLTTLFCAQGVPQLLAGDEFGNSQGGNNNAYCQDNDIGTLDWPSADPAMLQFVSGLIHLRKNHEAFRYPHWFSGTGDVAWSNADGQPFSALEWDDPVARSFACLMTVPPVPGATDAQRWLLLFNPADHAQSFQLPTGPWARVLDSAAALVLGPNTWATAEVLLGAIDAKPRTVIGLVQTDATTTPEGNLQTP
jgi:glycogen operon protein